MPITKTINFLPAVFQTETNQKFLNATLDQLVTEPNLRPINGFVGRQFAPGFTGSSTYITEPDKARQYYQLEPSVVVKNPISGEVDFHCTYLETLQKLKFYGTNTDNQSRLWGNEFYSYDPKIDLDKFINFGQYYWVPNGPDAVPVFSSLIPLEKEFFVYPNVNDKEYNISSYGATPNPDIVLARGGTYTFNINQLGKPFWIQVDPGLSGKEIANNNLSSRDILGVSNNGTDKGKVTFTVPNANAQDFYIDLPILQTVDLATNLTYTQIQSKLLSVFLQEHGGIDGQNTNLNGKYLIFAKQYFDDADWQSNGLFDSTLTPGFDVLAYDDGTAVDPAYRYGVWKINLTSTGDGDYVIDLTFEQSIPVNNAVIVQSGVSYGNTRWYTSASNILGQTPVITAPLNYLYYQDGTNSNQVGTIKLVDVGNKYINVDTDIVGKTNYVSPNGVTFTNGLKIKFDTSVTPTAYQNNEYYVEGVGTSIALVPVADLVINFAQARNNYNPLNFFSSNVGASLNYSKDQITITTGDYPSDANVFTGTFPNSINTNAIVKQDFTFVYPYRGGLDEQGEHNSISLETDTIGVTLPGIVINGVSNGWYVPSDNGTIWHYDSAKAKINGQDIYGGYVESNGEYVYKDSTFITANAWGNVSGFTSGYVNSDDHSKLIGWAADGYPIYGPYGYLNAGDATSPITRMTSSYVATDSGVNRPIARTVTLTANAIATNTLTVSSAFGLNPGMEITAGYSGTARIINNGLHTAVGPSSYDGGANQITLNTNVTLYAGTTLTFTFKPGVFIEDYSYLQGHGSLDQYNGRFCVTPEFPNGTYAYFATQDTVGNPVYPYFIGPSYFGSLIVNTNTSLSTPDYLLINRASRDRNPWSRRNRWFHKDVIQLAAEYNNTIPNFDQNNRAQRPIVEFIPNLQLFDFGKNGLAPVDLLDTTTPHPFLTVEGATAYYIDGISLVEGMRVIFAADQDYTTKNKIYQVSFIDPDNSGTTAPVIHLTLADDGNAAMDDTVSIFNGVVNAGKSFWFNGTSWIEGQAKIGQNQPPLFDVFDDNGISFGNTDTYPVSNNSVAFKGTKLFGYKVGKGLNDKVLGFPLTYKNFNNVGDIQFQNYFDADTFVYTIDKNDYTKNVNTGFAYQNNIDGTVKEITVWTTVAEDSKQYQNLSFTYDGLTNEYILDIVADADVVTPNLLVFVNYKNINKTDYQLYTLPNNKRLLTISADKIKTGDRIEVLIYSKSISQTGMFEVPPNLNFNPQNQTIDSLTLGDLRNHIGQLTENSLIFNGQYPGVSNLRDIPVTQQGGTILQQSAPTTYASLFLGDDKLNFINSLLTAQQEYTKFKNKFLTLSTENPSIHMMDPVAAVDAIIKQINIVKDKSFPWYYSDMVPYGDNKNVIEYTVFDAYQRRYEITNIFSNSSLNNAAILVYINGTQLIYGSDYTFLTAQPGIEFASTLSISVNDVITIVEYHNTDGCWIPETPSKLGLYPKYTPSIYVDSTYRTPRKIIKGHDGSITPAFNDYRDLLILELEKRIYNNIKVTYDEKLVNIYDTIPGKFRDTGYSLSEFNSVISRIYLQWAGANKVNYVKNSTLVSSDLFTYNYYQSVDKNTGEKLSGSWRSIYDYYYDTLTPHLTPWEMLGFSEQPDWWVSVYGPAPYTSGNDILWADLEAGYIAQGIRSGYDAEFARPGLSNYIPVNANGDLLPPQGVVTNSFNAKTIGNNWAAGQWGPAETAWRQSSEYPYAVQYAAAILKPAKYFSLGIAVHKYRYDRKIKQYLVNDTKQRIRPSDIDINGYVDSAGSVTRAAGYLNWISDYLTANGITSKSLLINFANNHTVQLAYPMAGFSDKTNVKVLAEQNSPNSSNESIIIPDSDYALVVSKSTPLNNPRYSAVIVEKTVNGYTVTGYDTKNPFFTAILPSTGGKSTSVSAANVTAAYYNEFTKLRVTVPYGTEFNQIQQVANFLSGYERNLLTQGFKFDYYDPILGQLRNWQLSLKEFIFWTQQNWTAGSTIVLSPLADSMNFVYPTATVDGITNSLYGTKVMNQNFSILNSDAYTVRRNDSTFNLSLNSNTDLIGLVDINLVQYEHVMVFNNKTQFNDIIYDPSSGQRQFRMKLIGFKTAGWTGQLSAPGFMYNGPNVPSWNSNTDYLQGDLVEYKNFYYSASKDLAGTTDFMFSDWTPVNKNNIKTGLLNNFARNAGNGQDFYDIDSVNLANEFDQYSLGLIGFRNRSYLTDLGLDDTSQVKFYQGYIKQKGTKNAIDALGNAKINGITGNIAINEEWAFRVGAYGALATNQFVELVLDERYTLNNPTSLEVQTDNTVVYSSLYSDPQAVYKTASTPWSSPFLLNRTTDSNRDNDILTAGYASLEDVDYTIFNLDDQSTFTANVDTIGVGNTIWTAIDYKQNWNVYRVDSTNTKVIKISNALNGKILITTDKQHNLAVDTTVIINQYNIFKGIYRVLSVESLNSFVVRYVGDLAAFSSLSGNSPLYKLTSLKFQYGNDFAAYAPVNGWKSNNKVWIDNDTIDNTWAVYNKTDPWEYAGTITRSSYLTNGNFGSAIALSPNGNFAAIGEQGYSANVFGAFASNIGAVVNYKFTFSGNLVEDDTLTSSVPNTVNLGASISSGNVSVVAGAPASTSNRGYVFAYKRGPFGSMTQSQILAANTNAAVKFGYSVSVSKDDQWLYVGAPDGNFVYVYGYDSSVAIKTETVSNVGANVANITLTTFTPESAELISVSNATAYFAPYVHYTVSGAQVKFRSNIKTGDDITVRQAPGYRFIANIAGNANTQFGFSLASSTDGAQIVIGAPTANATISNVSTSVGSISVYDRSVEDFITTGSSKIISTQRPLLSISKVYLNNVLKTKNVDYVVSGLTVTFTNKPSAGSIVRVETDQFNKIQESYPAISYAGQQFGYSVDLCPNNCSIYVGAPYQSSTGFYNGAVYRYVNQGKVYGTITGTTLNPTVTNGNSIRINDFEVIFSSSSLTSVINSINAANIPGITASSASGYLNITSSSLLRSDKLRILPGVGTALSDLGLLTFPEVQTIKNQNSGPYDYFGKKVRINGKSNALFVGSDIAKTMQACTFDVATGVTTIDTGSTTFKDYVNGSGTIWSFNYVTDGRNSIKHPGQFLYVQRLTPTGLKSNAGFGYDIGVNDYTLLTGAYSDSSISNRGGLVHTFNNPTRLLGWDVYKSQSPKVDLDCLIKAYTYSKKSQTILNNLDYIDPAKGKILGNAEQDISFKTDYDPAVYNNATNTSVSKNTSFYWNNTQVGQVWWDLSKVRYTDYEQSTIKYRTANWGNTFPGSSIDVYEWVESLYPPSQYVDNGGNGTPKYGDNSAYVTLTYIDPQTSVAVVKYYFWVKDKTTISPNQYGRSMPVASIRDFIVDPKGTGIKYYAAIRDDSIAVYNIVGDTTDVDTILHLDYRTQIGKDGIIHSEYALLSEGDTSSKNIPADLYNKLIDSVSGIDAVGNPVPDPNLPVQSRYGIDIRPRQSMFVDRSTAAKQMVEYVNGVFAKNIISQGYDLTNLSDSDPIPASGSGAYDQSVNNIEELSYIDIVILPTGYKVLVVSDSTVSGLWTIYAKASDNTWALSRVQSYRTGDFWEYADWYADDFNNTLLPNYTVNTFADLATIAIKSGDIIKIRNNGQGKWTLIRAYPNVVLTVGIQNGTIKLKDSLYDSATYGLSYDTDNFDSQRFDQNPSIETRKILTALHDDIFINQLSKEFLDLFFVFIYYILDEQKYIDWAFKTSFINVLHKLRDLDKPQIYAKENQDYYKQYIEEVKPYRTTIREYVLDYTGTDNVNGYVTDFDVPAYYDSVLKVYRSPSGEFFEDSYALEKPEYKDWLLNYEYQVDTITVIDGGTGYTLAPQVTITGSLVENDAVARAIVSNGVVSKIQVLYKGSGYITTPKVVISGGNGTGARAYARVTNNKVRSLKTTLVYDRITYDTQVLEWTANTSYNQGDLIAYNNVAYIVNADFTSGSSFVGNDLAIYPADKFVIANDRIQAYYNPELGQPGKDFSLLQTGIDYPGVTVEGALYSDSGSFDVTPFDSASFDPLTLNPDGTFSISESLLDTVIESSYDTTLGTKPEDIIIDGSGVDANGNSLGYVTTYSSHAPEELIPGRVFDTLDMYISTFAYSCASDNYATWANTAAFFVANIAVIDGGLGYSSPTITVQGGDANGSAGFGGTVSPATATATIDANGTITAITVIGAGTNYTTMPNIVITGANTSPARAAVRLAPYPIGGTAITTFDYHSFKDLNDSYGYYRAQGSSETTLTSNLAITDTTIHVANASVLTAPDKSNNAPGIIYINGERILYWTLDTGNNTISNIRRGISGTGSTIQANNSVVIDGGLRQQIPYSSHYIWTPNANTTIQTTSTADFVFKANVPYMRSQLFYGAGDLPVAITTETLVANVAANVITTESNSSITTEGGGGAGTTSGTATDGTGLFNSQTIQAVFIRQP